MREKGNLDSAAIIQEKQKMQTELTMFNAEQ